MKKKYVIDNKELMKEWNYEKNKTINPENITYGSIQNLWWICSKGHEWKASPNNRYKGTGCPYCNNKKILYGFNDLETINDVLAREWNYAKNEKLLPRDVFPNSHKVVWWKCKSCGMEWKASISNRNAGKGCPVCSKKKQGQTKVKNLISKKGSFADNFPHLIDEWDFNKNKFNPEIFTSYSKEKVWWICNKCNHEWQTTIYHRAIRNSQCPSCRGKVATDKNNLTVTHPQILKKWNYKKNTNILPTEVTYGSNRKVWWICSKGHDYYTSINNVVSGSQCPICCGQKVLVGFNDLQSINPVLAKEWHPNKNELKPTEVTKGSSKSKVWWLCPKGHEYQATVANRSNGTGCPICDKELKTSFPEQAIYFYFKQHTEALNRYLLNGKTEIDIYLPKFKIGIEYDGKYFHTGKNAIEKEKRKNDILKSCNIRLIRIKEVKTHLYEDDENIIYCKYDSNYMYIKEVITKICDRIFKITGDRYQIDVNISRDSNTIYSEYIKSQKENSLLIKNPLLAKEWHPTRNGYVKPDMVSYSSAKKVWWLGSCGHEWQSSIDNRHRGNGCPICRGYKLLVGFNDLATTHPEIIKEWDNKKNLSITPKEVTKGSHKKVWWICRNGHSYKSTICNRVQGKGCPICSVEKRIQHKRENIILKNGSFIDNYPHLLKDWDFDKNIVNPYEYSKGSDLKVWWICAKGHNYECTISNRIQGKGCPICVGKKIVCGINDLLTKNPELCKDWDYKKNILNPAEISPNTHKKAWWKCSKCGYEWEAQIKSRNIGTGCPKCSRKRKNNKEMERK